MQGRAKRMHVRKSIAGILLAMALSAGCAGPSGKSPLTVPAAFTPLRLMEIQPQGWIYAQMKRDLRGFTAFSELGEPEEVMGVLQDYHTAMGQLIFQYGGTLERFTGDGLMVFFNDPIPCDDPSEKAVKI